MFPIGELSERTGVTSKAISYYEEIELLPAAHRAENGYRVYEEPDVERLRFISRARALDFALDDIREILAFREREEPPCGYVMNLMQERIEEITNRIRDLERMQNELTVLHKAGQLLPEDVQMRSCVCHLLETGVEQSASGGGT